MSWDAFVRELDAGILPIYREHEQTFDAPGIHGRAHICRCVIFGEFMGRHLHAATVLRPELSDIRYAIAFHDAGREANGPDLWEHKSVALLEAWLAQRPGRTSRTPAQMAALLEAKSRPDESPEARILHDADVLDIMRPCCGHGGREGFWDPALHFAGDRDDPAARDPEVRARLIEEAWAFIQATEERKAQLAPSESFMREMLAILDVSRVDCPMLAGALLG